MTSASLLALGLMHLKVTLDIERNYRPYVFDMSYDMPGPKVIGGATLNFRTAAASLVWIRGVQFAARTFVARKKAEDVTFFAQTIVALDPYFYEVYSWHSAARMLAAGYPTPEDIEVSNDLIEKGMQYFPQDEALPKEAVANYIGWNRGVDDETRTRQLRRGIQFAEEGALRSTNADMLYFLALRFRQHLERLHGDEALDQAGEHAASRLDREMLVRLYFHAKSERARKSVLNRLRQLDGSDQLAAKLRDYAAEQASWYENSERSYMPFDVFTTVEPGVRSMLPHDAEVAR